MTSRNRRIGATRDNIVGALIVAAWSMVEGERLNRSRA